MMDTANPTEIRLNGEPARVAAGTVAELLAGLGLEPTRRGVAVARNGTLVRRGEWADTPVRAGDDLEVIHATQGG